MTQNEREVAEKTFVMLKPDALERGLVGEIVARLERKGLKLERLETKRLSKELIARHYAHLVGRDFYGDLESYATRGDVIASIWRGPGAIAIVRKLVGATDGADAEPGTIRGDFALGGTENLVHASDSPEAARREIALFFGDAR